MVTNVLAIGAHHDDLELGCGGSLAKFVSGGCNVYGLILTDSKTSFEGRKIYRTEEQALLEGQNASKTIGYDLLPMIEDTPTVGQLLYTTEKMQSVERLIFDLSIDLALCHWIKDLNTDHQSAAKIAITASRHVPTVLQYRSNWYQPSDAFFGTVFIDISDFAETKRKAIECYSGEIESRGRIWADTFLNDNRRAGLQISTEFAEVFEPVKVLFS